MFYRLKDNFALRGWTNLPHAIVDLNSGETLGLNKFTYTVLSLCNGKVPDSLLLPSQQKIVEKMLNYGVVEEQDTPAFISENQGYKSAACQRISSAHWSITGKCNLRCKHCYMSAPQAKFGELSKQQCFDIIKQLVEANIYKISLTGGEPFVRKDFWEIVDELVANRISIYQIYTNGFLVNKKLLDKFISRSLKPEFSLSYDGKGCHDWLRGVNGAEKRTIEAISLLVSKGFTVGVEMSLHKRNIHTLTESILYLASIGVSHIKATPTSNSGNWVGENECYTLAYDELYDGYLKFIREYKDADAPINIMLGGFFMCSKGSSQYSIPSLKGRGVPEQDMLDQPVCGSARSNMYIAADGRILPCIPLSGLPIEATMPNITVSNLTTALNDSTYLKAINTTQHELFSENEECNSCKHKFDCGGGCRASALISSNEYLGRDEAVCFFFKNNYEQKIREIYS